LNELESGGLLTIDQVARQLNVGRTFAWELTASGRLPTVRLGRLVRIRPEDLRRYVDGLADDETTSSQPERKPVAAR
jgi:excisionase family DNA binding protein